MESNIGLKLESSEDNDNDSNKKIDWGLCFSLLKNRGFNHNEILNLSYPQFNAYMNQINNPLTFGITIPYMGDGKDKSEEKEISSKEEFLSIVADMNKDFL